MIVHCKRPVTHIWESLKPQVSAKPTLKDRSWCLKVLNMVNHLMGLHYCSHWLLFQLRLWKRNAFIPCPHYRHCSKEVAYNKFILVPSFFLCSSLRLQKQNGTVIGSWATPLTTKQNSGKWKNSGLKPADQFPSLLLYDYTSPLPTSGIQTLNNHKTEVEQASAEG